MAIQDIKIESIFGGWSPSEYFSGEGQFLSSLGVDPEMPKDDSSTKPSGVLRPTAMSKFSGTEITGVPLWIVTNPKDTNAYVYANDGKCHVVNSSLAMGTAVNSGTALTASGGNGAAYYDNYLYLAKNADIARFGPLNGSPSLVQNYWTTTLSLTAPTNTTYPSINGVQMPNHAMHRHTDNRLYFCDVNAGNEGILSSIKTTKDTVEGDTDDGSAYQVLDFPYGYYPTALESYGTNLAVALIEGVSTAVEQGNAKLSFWDTTSSSFTVLTDVEFPDPLITALKNVNGILYVFSGNATGGCRISRYVGGQSFEEIVYLDDTYPPLQGAVDHYLNRFVFGGKTTTPAVAGSVFAYNSKFRNLPMGIHNILKASGTGANPWVTAVKYVTQGVNKQPIIGWDDDTAKGLDKLSTTYGTSIWRSSIFRVGENFDINKITLPLTTAVGANMTLTVKVYFDDASSNQTAATINNTNNSGDRLIKLHPQGFNGKNNFFIELTWSGTALLPVNLPITVRIETRED